MTIGATRGLGIAAIGVWALWTGCGFTPTDAALERRFREHRQEFEHLRSLIAQDSSVGILLSVHEDRTDPNEQEAFRRGLSKDRLQEYRRLLRQLGLIGVGTTNGEDIMFQVTASGFLGHGTRKGYLYSSVTLRRPTTTTAEIGQHRLEPIAGHWYLYYDVD